MGASQCILELGAGPLSISQCRERHAEHTHQLVQAAERDWDVVAALSAMGAGGAAFRAGAGRTLRQRVRCILVRKGAEQSLSSVLLWEAA